MTTLQPFGRRGLTPAAAKPVRGPACPSCGGELLGAFCHACGQPANVANNVGELAKDAVTRFLNFDYGTARGLWRLIIEPGVLAADWMRGRRVDTLTPWQTAFLVFSLLIVTPNAMMVVFDALHHTAHDATSENTRTTLAFWRGWSTAFALMIVPLNYLALRMLFGRRDAESGYRHLVVSLYQLGGFMLIMVPTVALMVLKSDWFALHFCLSLAAMLRQTTLMIRGAYGKTTWAAAWRALVVVGIDVVGFNLLSTQLVPALGDF